MHRAVWKARPFSRRDGEPKVAILLSLAACLACLAAVLCFEKQIRKWSSPQSLYVRTQAEMSDADSIGFVDRMEFYLRLRGDSQYPPMPQRLRREARAFGMQDPPRFRNLLVDYAVEGDAYRIKAVAYTLRYGLDNKNATIAMKQMEQALPDATEMLRRVFLAPRLRRRDQAGESLWIPYPSDGFRYSVFQ